MERKAVIGYEGLYEVSSDGDVFNVLKNPNIKLKQHIDNGYLSIMLRKDGKQKKHKVHRLVAIAFIENKNNYDQINHIDCNKQNNNLSNLEWCTQEQNTKHYLLANKDKIEKFSKKIIGINRYSNNTIILNSIRESSKYGFDRKSIRNCCNRIKDSHKGYKWSYVNE